MQTTVTDVVTIGDKLSHIFDYGEDSRITGNYPANCLLACGSKNVASASRTSRQLF